MQTELKRLVRLVGTDAGFYVHPGGVEDLNFDTHLLYFSKEGFQEVIGTSGFFWTAL